MKIPLKIAQNSKFSSSKKSNIRLIHKRMDFFIGKFFPNEIPFAERSFPINSLCFHHFPSSEKYFIMNFSLFSGPKIVFYNIIHNVDYYLSKVMWFVFLIYDILCDINIKLILRNFSVVYGIVVGRFFCRVIFLSIRWILTKWWIFDCCKNHWPFKRHWLIIWWEVNWLIDLHRRFA